MTGFARTDTVSDPASHSVTLTFVAMLILALTSIPSALAGPAKPLSVCEALRDDPTVLNGKVIAVRGGDCRKRFITNGVSWPNTWIESAETDEKAERAFGLLSDRLKKMHADPKQDRIWVTFVGRLETRQSMSDAVVSGPDGPLVRYGLATLTVPRPQSKCS